MVHLNLTLCLIRTKNYKFAARAEIYRTLA